MSDMNLTCIIGRLTRDAELKYTQGGTAVCNFSIGVNRSIPPKDGGEWKNEASFFECQVWGKLAESKHPTLTKGKQVCIRGELRQDRWEQDGQTRSKVYIVVDSIQPLADPRNKDAQDQPNPTSQPAAQPSRNTLPPRTYTPPPASKLQSQHGTAAPSAQPMFDDDIPF